jgi:hypothetical protein
MKKERIIIDVTTQKLHVEHARCLNGHTLMDPEVHIGGFPSIKVILQYGNLKGLVHLDPVYGSFHNLSDVDIPEGVVVDMLCPICSTSMQAENDYCEFCYSPMFALHLPKGGYIEGCLKNGCHQHKLRLVDIDEQLKSLHGDDHIQLLM